MVDPFCHERDEVEDSSAEGTGGWGQAARQKTGAQSNITHSIKDTRKTTDQHRTADTRRLNRETNEGNEGDTGGDTETMIR